MQDNYVLSSSLDAGDSPTEPVSLSEMKTYLRLSPSETFNDALILQLITTARQQLQDYLNIALIDGTVTARIQNDLGFVQLPYSAPTISITSIVDDNSNVIDTTNYKLKGSTFLAYATPIAINNFYSPCENVVNLVYDVSYESGIPVKLKTLIMQQTSWLYEHFGDELTTNLSPVVKANAKPYRKVF